jgi:ERCC4-type nuclease
MKIIVDYREKSVIEKLGLLKIEKEQKITESVEEQNLTIGDIHITQDDGTPVFILERKTVADLISSIKDGRYSEQAFRLCESGLPPRQICYIIEGRVANFKPGQKEMVYGAFYSLLYKKGFSVLHTDSAYETACLVWKIASKYSKDGIVAAAVDGAGQQGGGGGGETANSGGPSYIDAIAKTKKSHITPQNIDVIMLSQIPSVSVNSAAHVLAKHTNIQRLLENIAREGEAALADITYVNSKGQPRSLTKPCIKNIIKYLLK